jgi:hypothetical protein
MAEAWGMYVGEEKCIHYFGGQTRGRGDI